MVVVVQAVGVGEVGVGAAQLRGLLVHLLDKVAAGVVRGVLSPGLGEAPLPIGAASSLLAGSLPAGPLGRALLLRAFLLGTFLLGTFLLGTLLLGAFLLRGGALLGLDVPQGVLLVHILHQGQGRVVARGHHHQIQQGVGGEFLPHLHPGQGAAGAQQFRLHALGHGDHRVLQVGDVLVSHDVGHDLRHGGHGQGLVRVVGVHHRVRVQVQHKDRLAVRALVGVAVPVEGKALLRLGAEPAGQQHHPGEHRRRQLFPNVHGPPSFSRRGCTFPAIYGTIGL